MWNGREAAGVSGGLKAKMEGSPSDLISEFEDSLSARDYSLDATSEEWMKTIPDAY
jgi:hypothetical protein